MNSHLEKFIKINLIKVAKLKEGYVFAGKIKFSDLYKISKFTAREDNKLFFQRKRDDIRINDIKEFLIENLRDESCEISTNIFPSSIILYNQLHIENGNIQPDEIEISEDLADCFFEEIDGKNDICTIYIPNNKEITLIVDGQHRVYATKLLYDELREKSSLLSESALIHRLENLEFIVTYLIGYELSWPSKIFIDVNFKQKPVNRSLYYDIFGSLPPKDDDDKDDSIIKLSHDLCELLNEDDNSPIKGMIKMLGTGNGLFSQGFMVDAFRKIFDDKSGVWIEYAIDYNKGDQTDGKYLILPRFMKAYLSTIRECYDSSWPDKSRPYTAKDYDYSILCKTTGMGAFLRLIIDIFPRVYDKPDMEEEILKILKRISEEGAKELFKTKNHDGSAARFAGAGALGLQNALYKELVKRYGLNKEENHQPALFEKSS